MKKLGQFLFQILILVLNTIFNVLITSCVSGMLLLKLMNETEIDPKMCLGISILTAVIVFAHIKFGQEILEKVLEKPKNKINNQKKEKENDNPE